VLLERFNFGHKHGSSHGRTRIFRLSYPDPHYVEKAKEALRLWRRLERDSGESLLTTMGGLDTGEGIERNARALRECGVEHEMSDGKEVSKRFPSLQLDPYEPVLYQPDGGVVAAERSVTAFARLAVAGGVEIREGETATAIEPSDRSVRVSTEHGLFEAEVVVVTAGAWAKPLLATAGIDLPVRATRETVAYYELLGEPAPPLVDWNDPAIYSLPSPGQGLKAAQHIAGPEVDPDSAKDPSNRSVEIVSAWVKQRYPTANDSPHLVETCLYTNTDDERFILERHGRIVVGSACSGHGFKFAPVTGERLASLAQGLT
ncbi:MAG: FAD-dependent oxidoreductase, partial [Actinomycetota bacterium]